MEGRQFDIYDYMDEKQNINLLHPHINIQNLYIISNSTNNQSRPLKKTHYNTTGINFKQLKFYDNLEKRIFDGIGEYGIPQIQGVYDIGEIGDFIRIDHGSMKEKHPEEKVLHFFCDDYKFERVWSNPDKYIPMLSRYKYVLAPDFSIYQDFPRIMQIFNHYRKHWLAAYWQENGVNVLPTITWGDKTSWQFCFDGEPENSVVVTSSVGAMKNKEQRKIFVDGYYEMVRRLNPSCVIFYGSLPEECKGNIIRVKQHNERFREAMCDG